jgi:hypothetical protein
MRPLSTLRSSIPGSYTRAYDHSSEGRSAYLNPIQFFGTSSKLMVHLYYNSIQEMLPYQIGIYVHKLEEL